MSDFPSAVTLILPPRQAVTLAHDFELSMRSPHDKSPQTKSLEVKASTGLFEERHMTSPIRLQCNAASEIPSPEEIQTTIGREYHMVLQFPLKLHIDKNSIINRLAAAMPDYSIFNSGTYQTTDNVTVMPVIAKATVLAHSEKITRTVTDYINTCSKMLESFKKGLLSDWTADVHGEHVRLENKITRQEIEVPLGGPPEPRDVDPYFFALFVKSTPGLQSVAELISSDFHDAARMLAILYGPRGGRRF